MKDFLFSDSPTNPITIEYKKESQIDELVKIKIEIDNKKRELESLKNRLDEIKIKAKSIKTVLKTELEKKEDENLNISKDSIFISAKTKLEKNKLRNSVQELEKLTLEEEKILKLSEKVVGEVLKLRKLVKAEIDNFIKETSVDAQKECTIKNQELAIIEKKWRKFLKSLNHMNYYAKDYHVQNQRILKNLYLKKMKN